MKFTSLKASKTRHDKILGNVEEFFNILNVNFNLRGASTHLMLPSFNLEYMHKSQSYLTTKLWNGLPTRVRECPDLAAFRRALLSFIICLLLFYIFLFIIIIFYLFFGLLRIWVAGPDTWVCYPIACK